MTAPCPNPHCVGGRVLGVGCAVCSTAPELPAFVPDVRVGDCRALMAQMPAGSVDAIVTDPPYELDFMGKGWDRSGIAFRPSVWREALRVTAPGGYLAAFGGTRTFHRLACAIEDAGWEIRDCVLWLYGSGMPKSHDVSKAIDKAAGAERRVVGTKVGRPGYSLAPDQGRGTYSAAGRDSGVECQVTAPATDAAAEWNGWGTALKPAWEPIILARKPLDGTVAANAQTHGTGGLNIDACRVGTEGGTGSVGAPNRKNTVYGAGMGGLPAVALDAGRWPANVLLDEAAGEALDAAHPATRSKRTVGPRAGKDVGTFGAYEGQAEAVMGHDDAGGPSRYFYCAKASRAEREAGLDALPLQVRGMSNGAQAAQARGEEYQAAQMGLNRTVQRRNIHPTVKPLALMRWLARLITPAGGLVLDPFTGSGSTGCAAVLEGFAFVGLELLEEHAEIARARTIYWQSHPDRALARRVARTAKKAATGPDALLLRAREVLAR